MREATGSYDTSDSCHLFDSRCDQRETRAARRLCVVVWGEGMIEIALVGAVVAAYLAGMVVGAFIWGKP